MLGARESNTLEIVDGKLTGRFTNPIVDARVKADRFSTMRRRFVAGDGFAIAIGDGRNDLPMLEAADVSFAYRAKPLVRAQATYAINPCRLDAVLRVFR